MIGTAAYMSPEQARGKSVDKRADIWAFGAVLYEMLSGRKAFEGETVSDTLAAVLTREPDWSALPAADTGRPAGSVAPLPRPRPADPAAGHRRRARPARSTLHRRPGCRPARRSGRGRPWLWALGAAALASLLTAMAFRLFVPASRPSPVLRKFDLVAPDLDFDWAVGPMLSPDGSRVAYCAGNRVWVRDLDQLAARPVAEISAPQPLGWSPDSDALVFGDRKKLWRVPVRGGASVAIAEVPGTGNVLGAAWSRSGQIAFSLWRGDMYQVPAAGGAPSLLFKADTERVVDFHYPSWLPNGDLLYLIHWKDASSRDGRTKDYLAVYDGAKQIPLSIDVGGADAWPTAGPAGILLYLRQGANAGLWAAPFDWKGRRAAGEPFLVAQSAVSFSASAEDSLLYVEQSGAEVVKEMVWVDRAGKTVGVVGEGREGLSQVALSPDGRRIAYVAGPPRNGDIWVRDLDRATDTRLTFGDEDELQPVWLSPARVAFIQMKTTSGRRRRPDPGDQRRRLRRAAGGRSRSSTGSRGARPDCGGRREKHPPDRRRAWARTPARGRASARWQPRSRSAGPSDQARAGRGRGAGVPGWPPAGLRDGEPGRAAGDVLDPLPDRRGALAGLPSRGEESPVGAGWERALLPGGRGTAHAGFSQGERGDGSAAGVEPGEPLRFRHFRGSQSSYLGGGDFDVAGDGQRFLVVRPDGVGERSAWCWSRIGPPSFERRGEHRPLEIS